MARPPPILHPSSSTSFSSSSILLPVISTTSPHTSSTLHFKPSLSSLFPSTSSLHLSSSSTNVARTRVSTAEVEFAPVPDFDIQREIQRLTRLRNMISRSNTFQDKIKVLDCETRVEEFFSKTGFSRVITSLNIELEELFLLKCLVASGQEHVLDSELEVFDGEFESDRSLLRNALYGLAEMIENWDFSSGQDGGGGRNGVDQPVKLLLKTLRELEQFYDSIGGIIGYQIMVLEILSSSISTNHSMNWSRRPDESLKNQIVEIHVPGGVDLSQNTEYASQAALWGIEGLPELGEIYPLGGSGDRLGLVDPDTGKCLPAAMLPFCGRTLLEGLIRDLQAREFLYFKIHGRQCVTPVAIMTSSAKNNHERITSLCETLSWFGRGRSSFQLFEQPLVPAVSAENGQWLVRQPFSPVCKPGGHGVIWKLAHDKGIFQWFYGHGRKGATVRQVSNVVAATDVTLLALAGIGLRHGKKLGFASCKRKNGATEGINVLMEKRGLDGKWAYGLSCIEYTEFDKFGIAEDHVTPCSLQENFPANTNILYVDLASAEKVGSSKDAVCLPGMVLNLKKFIAYVDHLGFKHSVPGGRLECTMQSIADNFLKAYSSRCYNGIEDDLDTYIVYNERKRVTSSAKRKRKIADKSLRQTPDGALLDIIRNASDILSYCDVKVPKIDNNEKYCHSGPPFLIFLHPALGPLWEVTRQKFHGGSISKGSELQIEVAEFLWKNVQLDGTLIVTAENVMGSTRLDQNDEPILHYGYRSARCKLQNVKVLNKGIDWSFPENNYWKHDVQRFEAVKIILHGNAEFEAANVILEGNYVFEVPDGHKLLVNASNTGISVKLTAIEKEKVDTGSWSWKYNLKGTHIDLEMVEF